VRPKTTQDGTESAEPLRGLALARLAAAQHGVVALAQLRDLGWSASGVRSRVARGHLHRVHNGVFAVGHPLLSWNGQLIAAVLACGPRSALSHFAATGHLELMPRGRPPIDVTSASRTGRSRPGIRSHCGTLLLRDVVVKENIRCTSVARTILDVADHLSPRALERVVDQAEVQRLFDMRAMDDVLARSAGRRGAAKLRAVLAVQHEPALTMSEIEELMLAICVDFKLPRPIVNEYVEGEKVDFHWPQDRVIAETDGRYWHGTARRRENDLARDRRLQLAGWRVLRFSWRAVAQEPAAVAAELAAFLTAPAAPRIAS
jgi:very-short-patch-repair endonuclease